MITFVKKKLLVSETGSDDNSGIRSENLMQKFRGKARKRAATDILYNVNMIPIKYYNLHGHN